MMCQDYIHLSDLFEYVARHLSGRCAQVRFRRPVYAGRLGQAYRCNDIGVIDISPDLDDAKALRIFLHEVAHLKTDWHELPQTSGLPPASINMQALDRVAYLSNAKIIKQESHAEVLAQRWLSLAQQLSGAQDIKGLLLFLANHEQRG